MGAVCRLRLWYGRAIWVGLCYFSCVTPPHWAGGGLFGYLAVTAILLRFCIACYEIPSSALAPELSPDYNQRTSLLAFRWLFGLLGGASITHAGRGVRSATARCPCLRPSRTRPNPRLRLSSRCATSPSPSADCGHATI